MSLKPAPTSPFRTITVCHLLTKTNISVQYVPPAPKEVWTREIPAYLRFKDRSTPSPGSSHSTESSSFSYLMSYSPPQSPAPLKGHILNPHVTPIEKADLSVLLQPSHSVLGHLGIRTTTSDGLLATTVTMRYKHKVLASICQHRLIVVCNDHTISSYR
jgi:hypothetical protein